VPRSTIRGAGRVVVLLSTLALVNTTTTAFASTRSGAVTVISGISAPFGIAAGPDGARWFTDDGNNTIGRVTSAGVVTTFGDRSIKVPGEITAGPDGALWFANNGDGSIGRITTSGSIAIFRDFRIFAPAGIAAGPDHAMWFTAVHSIGRVQV
jgi:virginiamycin B lyase